MKQYLNTLQEILDKGVEKESGRANMPNTIGISKADIKMDLSEGFPLLTTKKMFWKGIVHELLWFLRGETNIKYLVDNKVNIWNGDAYRWYLKWWDEYGQYVGGEVSKFETIEDFIHVIKEEVSPIHQYFGKETGLMETYVYGDLGKVYGYQWRNQNGVDQVQQVLDGLKDNPYSRYHIIDGWNKADFPEMALPPCHLLYQFIVRPLSIKERIDLYNHDPKYKQFKVDHGDGNKFLEKYDEWGIPKFYLDLNMYQRSVDTALGAPYNLASMSILLMLFAKVNNMIPGIANWTGGDTHLYINHIDKAKEQLLREPMKLPELNINKELNNLNDICDLTLDDFELINYNSHPKIDFELFSGLKK